MKKPRVSIVMGSDSDLEKMSEAAKVLEELQIGYEIQVLSAHRTPQETADFAKSAQSRGIIVIIAGAGGAAALAGTIAALITLPVIGVPIKSKSLEGIDSLLSTVQMPPGIPVATVGIDSAANAGLLAAIIIGANDEKVNKRIKNYKDSLRRKNIDKNTKLKKIGWPKYLNKKIKK